MYWPAYVPSFTARTVGRLTWKVLAAVLTEPPPSRKSRTASSFSESSAGGLPPVLPPAAEGHDHWTLRLLAGKVNRNEWLLVSNLNAMVFDFATRQKVQGQTLNLFIIEQLPVIAPDDYGRQFGTTTARDLVRDHVLRLTYTADDLVPFARDLGCDGPPFIWDEEERRHLRARLDALYFHLYGLSRNDADYTLSTFTITQKEDEAEFGTYRTRSLILAYMSAFSAGDTETRVVG